MTYAIVGLAVVCVLLIALTAGLLIFMRERFTAQDRMVQSMADRIQRPDVLPVHDTKDFVVPEATPDEWATVGQISIDPDYGLGDDG